MARARRVIAALFVKTPTASVSEAARPAPRSCRQRLKSHLADQEGERCRGKAVEGDADAKPGKDGADAAWTPVCESGKAERNQKAQCAGQPKGGVSLLRRQRLMLHRKVGQGPGGDQSADANDDQRQGDAPVRLIQPPFDVACGERVLFRQGVGDHVVAEFCSE